jgi:hypothetical protein
MASLDPVSLALILCLATFALTVVASVATRILTGRRTIIVRAGDLRLDVPANQNRRLYRIA